MKNVSSMSVVIRRATIQNPVETTSTSPALHRQACPYRIPAIYIVKRIVPKAASAGVPALFTAGDASELPFRDGVFGVITIAFGFRNLTYRNPGRDRYLAEIFRVLEPGGRFVIVESSQPRSRLFRALVHLYTRVVVSFLGGFISGQRGAYKYLAHSAVHFYGPEELSELLLSAGFSNVEHRPLLGGVAAIHIAYK